MSSRCSERKFWQTTELIEHLLPFLDSKSTMVLAQNHQETVNILQGSVAWNKLIKRSCPCKGRRGRPEGIENKINVMKNLVAILKLMENPQSNLMVDLLHLICKRFPEEGSSVTLDCTCHLGGHIVSMSGFRLLEEVEGAFGTAEQYIFEVWVRVLKEPVLLALAARASRQQDKVTSIRAGYVALHTKTSAQAFNILLWHASVHTANWGTIYALWDIGEEGWKALAEAIQQPALCNYADVYTTKRALDGGRREDIKKVFYTVCPENSWWVRSDDPPYKHKEVVDYGTMEARWTKLLQILEMSKDDWAAQPLPQQLEPDEEVEELEDENQEEEAGAGGDAEEEGDGEEEEEGSEEVE